jgi:glycosyltransferase involved in cell wall biosynthesis
MRIAFYLPNSGLEDVDLSNPETGNPGIGGTHFHLVAIPYFLSKRGIECLIFAQSIANLPKNTSNEICTNQNEAITLANNLNVNYLVIWQPSLETLQDASNYNVNLIVYGQNFVWEKDFLNILSANKNVKSFVAVGNEMVDYIRDHPIINKTRVINNAVNYKYLGNFISSDTKDQIVCYVGSLIPEKGFHILASFWKDISGQCPNAQLHIIGSGQLYDRGIKLGKFNLASEEYENLFMSYLQENGKLMGNVHFFGNLGVQKWQIMERSMVGIPNPSAATETFCITGVEFQALGVPVVTVSEFGFLDTIKNGYSGFLVKSKKDLVRKIVTQLSNVKLNEKYSNNSRTFSERFDFDIAVEKWLELFNELNSEKYNLRIENIKSNIFYKKKYLKEIIRIFGLNGKFPLIKDKSYSSLVKMLIKKIAK